MGNVKFNEPMSRHTSLRVGGPADAYVEPETVEELSMLVNWLWQNSLEYIIIGEGTNLLVRDNGIRGTVIVLTKCLNEIAHTRRVKDGGIIVKAMAGTRMRSLCSFAINHGLEGMNMALGIPGTVGGGIMMNAGTVHGSMENVLDSINVLMPTGQIKRIGKQDLKFHYRKLDITQLPSADCSFETDSQKPGTMTCQPIILDGCFCLDPSDPRKIKKEAEQILNTRKRSQPKGLPSAGCFFKNPGSGETAGQLIDKAGLKGKSIGGAQVSEKHANFIINRGRASASDIISLMELIQETVSGIFNVDLEPEIKIVGE